LIRLQLRASFFEFNRHRGKKVWEKGIFSFFFERGGALYSKFQVIHTSGSERGGKEERRGRKVNQYLQKGKEGGR